MSWSRNICVLKSGNQKQKNNRQNHHFLPQDSSSRVHLHKKKLRDWRQCQLKRLHQGRGEKPKKHEIIPTPEKKIAKNNVSITWLHLRLLFFPSRDYQTIDDFREGAPLAPFVPFVSVPFSLWIKNEFEKVIEQEENTELLPDEKVHSFLGL